MYGGSFAVGAFAIKLAVASNLHPIVAVAGAGSNYVSSLLDPAKGDAVIDYCSGRTDLQDGISSALLKTEKSTRVLVALDTICKGDSAEFFISFLGPHEGLAHVLSLANPQLLLGQTTDLVMIDRIYSSDDESLYD